VSAPLPAGPPSADDTANFPALYAKTRRFSVGVPRNLTVLADGSVLYLRSRDGLDPTLCLWRIRPAAGDQEPPAEELLVDPTQLESGRGGDGQLPAAELARRERARESAGGIVSYAVDRAGRRACFTVAGALFVCDLATGGVTNPSNNDDVFDPRLSPDGTHVAYVAGHDLRVVELDDDGNRLTERTLADEPVPRRSSDGPATVQWGRAEFVAAEEMQRSRGYWWSPNSDQLLVTRTDEARVATWWIADPAHPAREPNLNRYPVAGSANAEVELWLVELDGTRREVRWNDANVFEYLANVVWKPGRAPIVVQQTRDQRRVSMSAVDLESLTVAEQYAVSDDIWVELLPSSPTVCGNGLLTVEDRQDHPADPGHRALVLGGDALTDTSVQINAIVGHVVEDGQHTVVVSGWTHPTEVHLFAVTFSVNDQGRLDGQAEIAQLTTEPGVHRGVMRALDSSGEVVVVVTSASPSQQSVEVIAYRCSRSDLAAGRLGPARGAIADRSQRSPVPALPTFVDLGADRLASALFLPSYYDGDEPLPVLLDPYGGPHAQRVLKNHTSHLVSQWFAEQGFAVLVTDGRGTPGRGPWWERQVWGDLSEPVLEDQIEALETAAEEFDVLDLSRVGIRGWSFGGYLAALAVLRRPDRFHAAVAGAPVTTWNLYDTHYTERYLGRPDLYPQHYRAGDLLAAADGLQRPLLLIHGLADDNVVAAHTLRLSTALLAAGKHHQVLPLSGVTHMTPQEAVAENLLWFQLDFLRNALGLPDASLSGTEAP
jgi:dipeptidyl-peptidase-4